MWVLRSLERKTGSGDGRSHSEVQAEFGSNRKN